jgi:hypothetical protein
VKSITQDIGFRGVIPIDKRISLPLSCSRDQIISENIGKKRISSAESGDRHDGPVGRC